jgi:hypothetical protein
MNTPSTPQKNAWPHPALMVGIVASLLIGDSDTTISLAKNPVRTLIAFAFLGFSTLFAPALLAQESDSVQETVIPKREADFAGACAELGLKPETDDYRRCVTTFENADLKSDALPLSKTQPDAEITIDAQPGEYQWFGTKLTAGADQVPKKLRFEFSYEKLQPTKRWKPYLSLCINDEAVDNTICLSFIKTTGGHFLSPELKFVNRGETEERKEALPELIVLAGEHPVELEFNKDTVKFIIAPELTVERKINFVPAEFYFSCSSLLCKTRIFHPQERQ